MRSAFIAITLLTSSAFAAELRGAGRAWAGPGFDTNAKRDYVSPGVPTQADGFVFGLGQVEGAVELERVRLVGSYDLAARKFFTLASEDTVVQNAQAEATVASGQALAAGLAGRARDRRGADRDYTDLVGEAVVDFFPTEAVDVRLRGGAHRFLYWPRFAYSFSGPDGSLQAKYRFNRRHSASVFGNVNLRTYNAVTNANPKDPAPPAAVTRFDSVASAGISYSYRGPFQLSIGYSYFDQTSNSFGETLRRHRLSVSAGVRLPWQLTVLASGALQIGFAPDGVYLSPELQVVEDEENSSSVTVKIVRPVTKFLEVDIRYALYVNALINSNFFYLRQVGSVGVSVSF